MSAPPPRPQPALLAVTLTALMGAAGCGGPTGFQREVAAVSPSVRDQARPEPDDENALVGQDPVEPAEGALALPTTGHLALSDDTDRFRRTFGVAPRLLTPWDVALADIDLGIGSLELAGRYADLEPAPGPEVTRHPMQHQSLVLAFRPGGEPASDVEEADERPEQRADPETDR